MAQPIFTTTMIAEVSQMTQAVLDEMYDRGWFVGGVLLELSTAAFLRGAVPAPAAAGGIAVLPGHSVYRRQSLSEAENDRLTAQTLFADPGYGTTLGKKRNELVGLTDEELPTTLLKEASRFDETKARLEQSKRQFQSGALILAGVPVEELGSNLESDYSSLVDSTLRLIALRDEVNSRRTEAQRKSSRASLAYADLLNHLMLTLDPGINMALAYSKVATSNLRTDPSVRDIQVQGR
jgi:hypothetical protein